MLQNYRSQVGREQSPGTVIRNYETPQGFGEKYNHSSDITMLQGIEEQLRANQKKVIEITTKGESPLMQKVYFALYRIGILSPERRAQQKIHDLNRVKARYDLAVSGLEANAEGYRKETRELVANQNEVGNDCIQLEEMLDKLQEEYAKLEGDEKKIQENLKNESLPKDQARTLAQEFRSLSEEKRNVDYDVSNLEHQLNNAVEIYETLDIRIKVRDDQYTASNFSLRKLQDQRRGLFGTIEYLKLYAENNPLTSVIEVIKLMQEGEQKTALGQEILDAYEGTHQGIATVMDNLPQGRSRQKSRHEDLYARLRSRNKSDRATRLQEIKQRIYGTSLVGGDGRGNDASPDHGGNGSSPVVTVT